jgi:tetratricopeptide (TPR) repeat protein
MFRKSLIASALVVSASFVSSGLFAAAATPTFEQAIAGVAHDWARVSYQTPAAEKDAAFTSVIATSQQVVQSFPGKAEPLIWEAIVLASAASTEGGLGALHKAKQSRDLLLAAEAIDPNAMDGSIYSSLGSLYAKVPGWPIGFGDKKEAKRCFEKAIAIAPTDIDANYFYADFLADQGQYARSAEYLNHALAAPPRPGREDADAGRRAQALALLESLKQKHGDQLASK